MLAYLATKEQFLEDAPLIEDIVRAEVKKKLNFMAPENEYRAWRNSLGNAMFHVMDTKSIPDDAGVAIEYRLNGRRFRIDFMISGIGPDGKESLVIVELKQWTEMQFSDLAEHVRTYVGGGMRDERHPSHQAWSYASHMKMYNEYVYENEMNVQACVYLHNCIDSSVVNSSRYEAEIRKALVFLKGEREELRSLIIGSVVQGAGIGLL